MKVYESKTIQCYLWKIIISVALQMFIKVIYTVGNGQRGVKRNLKM